MRGKSFAAFMKVIALLNILIFLYPAFIVFRYYMFNTTGGIFEVVLLLFSMYFGMVATRFICRKEYYFTTRLLSYIAIFIPILVSIAVYHGEGIPRVAFELVLSGIFYIIGSTNFSKSYNEIFAQKTLGTDIIFLTAVLILVSAIQVLNPLRGIIFIFIAFNIPITMFIISEANIDQVFLTRGVEIPEVQRSIRKENIKLVALLYAIILVLFNIKDLLAAVLRFCFLVYIKISIFLMHLISLIYPADSGSGGNGASAQPPDLEISDKNDTANVIFTVISVILILLILYKLIPMFIKAIVKLIRLIKAKLSRKIKITDNKFNDNECEEIIEITKKSTDSWFRRKKRTNLFSLLRKTKEPAERIRLIYRIILTELGRKGINITASDTAGQVVEKAGSKDELKADLENITPVYEQVRYGEITPNEEGLKAVEEEFLKITGKSRV